MPGIDFEARRPWLASFLADDGLATIVAEANGEPLGFACWQTHTGESAYLHQLVVAPAAKGGGLATRLLDHVKSNAPLGLALDVNQANARAVRFYRREGFAIVSAGTNPASGLATWRMVWRGSAGARPIRRDTH